MTPVLWAYRRSVRSAARHAQDDKHRHQEHWRHDRCKDQPTFMPAYVLTGCQDWTTHCLEEHDRYEDVRALAKQVPGVRNDVSILGVEKAKQDQTSHDDADHRERQPHLCMVHLVVAMLFVLVALLMAMNGGVLSTVLLRAVLLLAKLLRAALLLCCRKLRAVRQLVNRCSQLLRHLGVVSGPVRGLERLLSWPEGEVGR
mmetsp:Transcript_14356/g.33735  ORF Transcript_14356/g.33735 Transcript_14356/m.33735 type:complete len:200 (-) Transcript_14356:235-834(-)